MRFEVRGAPHVPAPTSVTRMMAQVLLALVPGVVAHLWYFGPGVLIQIALATAFAVGFEYLMLRARGQPVKLFLSDLSAPVTAVLFALCVPPLLPWWGAFVGMGFAIVIAKHLYGGLGYNVFNPAMVGYAVVLIAFPRDATAWLAPAGMATETLSLGQILAAILGFGLPDGLSWDAVTMATPLDLVRTAQHLDITMAEIHQEPMFTEPGGQAWKWIAYMYALGGMYIVLRRATSWHVPVAVLGTVVALTFPVYLFDPDANPNPLEHILTGGMVLGAFFIATDPVSGSTTPRGRLLFGAGVAALTLAIRRWGGYPDGIAFAVLIMNSAVPLIDRYTKPRVFGQGRRAR